MHLYFTSPPKSCQPFSCWLLGLWPPTLCWTEADTGHPRLASVFQQGVAVSILPLSTKIDCGFISGFIMLRFWALAGHRWETVSSVAMELVWSQRKISWEGNNHSISCLNPVTRGAQKQSPMVAKESHTTLLSEFHFTRFFTGGQIMPIYSTFWKSFLLWVSNALTSWYFFASSWDDLLVFILFLLMWCIAVLIDCKCFELFFCELGWIHFKR